MDKAFKGKCNETKEDKRHNTSHVRFKLTDEQWKDIKTWSKNKKEESKESRKSVDAPAVSLWNPEWTYLATGKRMTKGQLKRYCKEKGKIWENQ